MDTLYIVICVLAFGYLAFIVIERFYVAYLRKQFKLVIHVNGIRGKSTTTRLIDAGLRNCGYKVFSKTTGTIPTIINVDNEDVIIHRLGLANIREQIAMLKKAKKQKAEVLVLECMAVNPELQKISEHSILKADIAVITNVRLDHLQDMADDLDGIANALSLTIPTNGTLIINPSEYVELFTKKAYLSKSKTVIAEEYTGEDTLDTFSENIAISIALSKVLNLDQNLFFEGMKKYHHDAGAFKPYVRGKTIFLNGLSINDPTSIEMTYDRIIKEYEPSKLTIILNNRHDRASRVYQHIELMKKISCKKIILMGSHLNYVRSKLKDSLPNVEIVFINKIEDLLDEEVIFAIGNIADKGMEVLKFFQGSGDEQ